MILGNASSQTFMLVSSVVSCTTKCGGGKIIGGDETAADGDKEVEGTHDKRLSRGGIVGPDPSVHVEDANSTVMLVPSVVSSFAFPPAARRGGENGGMGTSDIGRGRASLSVLAIPSPLGLALLRLPMNPPDSSGIVLGSTPARAVLTTAGDCML
jgi:hypothetical protein